MPRKPDPRPASCSPPNPKDHRVPFERFTQGARNIVVLSQKEARELSHDYVGTEHLLVGLVLDYGVVGKALRELEITYEKVRDQIIEIIGRGNVAPAGHSPFTIRAREVLTQANEISHNSGHGYIGPEHLIIAILKDEESVACLTLAALGSSPSTIRRRIAASFARAYTAGTVFHGFTAAAKSGPYDANPLRDDAESAAADAIGDLASSR